MTILKIKEDTCQCLSLNRSVPESKQILNLKYNNFWQYLKLRGHLSMLVLNKSVPESKQILNLNNESFSKLDKWLV